jgi:RNA polymerase sigma factor (sigma-70 family)
MGGSERFDGASKATDSDGDEEMDAYLWAAIAELEETSAQILILRYIHGQSIAEIAKVIGTTRSTVAVSLFRSRARLKRLIRASQLGEET